MNSARADSKILSMRQRKFDQDQKRFNAGVSSKSHLCVSCDCKAPYVDFDTLLLHQGGAVEDFVCNVS